MTAIFQYAEAVLEQHPNIVGGAMLLEGLQPPHEDAAFQALYAQEQATVKQRIGQMPLSEIPSLSAWRSAFRRFGAEPTKQRSAAEALLRRLTKKGDIPAINPLVDRGNLVSIRYGLPVAVFDLHEVTGTVTVAHATGKERFRELGSDAAVNPPAGEVIFVDACGMVIARRWCWRQSAESAANLSTVNALVTVEAQHEAGMEEVKAALEDLKALFQPFVQQISAFGIISAVQPAL